MELHVCATNDAGRLWHTIRRADGSWTAFGDVRAVTGGSGFFADVACASPRAGELHVCGLLQGGAWWHTIRAPDGGWLPFGDVVAAAGGVAANSAFWSVAAGAGSSRDLHLCGSVTTRSGTVVSTDKSLFHTIRAVDGSWRPFQRIGGSFDDVDCSNSTAGLHVCGVTFDRGGVATGQLRHSIRRPDGTWLPFGDVRSVVLGQNPGTPDPGTFGYVACAVIDPQLLVVAQAGGALWSTTRRGDGSWTPFANLGGQLGQRPYGRVACASLGGELHLCAVAGGKLWHSIRQANGAWLPFGDVVDVVTGVPGSPHPGTLVSVGVALVS